MNYKQININQYLQFRLVEEGLHYAPSSHLIHLIAKKGYGSNKMYLKNSKIKKVLKLSKGQLRRAKKKLKNKKLIYEISNKNGTTAPKTLSIVPIKDDELLRYAKYNKMLDLSSSIQIKYRYSDNRYAFCMGVCSEHFEGDAPAFVLGEKVIYESEANRLGLNTETQNRQIVETKLKNIAKKINKWSDKRGYDYKFYPSDFYSKKSKLKKIDRNIVDYFDNDTDEVVNFLKKVIAMGPSELKREWGWDGTGISLNLLLNRSMIQTYNSNNGNIKHPNNEALSGNDEWSSGTSEMSSAIVNPSDSI